MSVERDERTDMQRVADDLEELDRELRDKPFEPIRYKLLIAAIPAIIEMEM